MKWLLVLGLVAALVAPAAAQTGPPRTPASPPIAVTLESDTNVLIYGGTFELTAIVSATSADTPAGCVQGVEVHFARIVVGNDAPHEVGTAITNDQGVAVFSTTADRTAYYIAQVFQSNDCNEAWSTAEPVRVRKLVRLVEVAGGRLRATVAPCEGHEGDRVALLKRRGGEWGRVAVKRSNENCRAWFSRTEGTYKARSPKTDEDHEAGVSASFRL